MFHLIQWKQDLPNSSCCPHSSPSSSSLEVLAHTLSACFCWVRNDWSQWRVLVQSQKSYGKTCRLYGSHAFWKAVPSLCHCRNLRRKGEKGRIQTSFFRHMLVAKTWIKSFKINISLYLRSFSCKFAELLTG